MSISAMTNVAFIRREDVNVPGVAPAGEAPATFNQIASATAGTPNSQSDVTSALQVIVTFIPTEVLTLYVAVLAAIQDPNRRSFRSLWIAFFFFLIITPIIVWLVYAAKVRTASANNPLPLAPSKWPLWEMFAATVAYAAWAFALPDSPFKYSPYTADWYSPALAGVIVLVISTLLGLLARVVQRPLPA